MQLTNLPVQLFIVPTAAWAHDQRLFPAPALSTTLAFTFRWPTLTILTSLALSLSTIFLSLTLPLGRPTVANSGKHILTATTTTTGWLLVIVVFLRIGNSTSLAHSVQPIKHILKPWFLVERFQLTNGGQLFIRLPLIRCSIVQKEQGISQYDQSDCESVHLYNSPDNRYCLKDEVVYGSTVHQVMPFYTSLHAR
uniref:Uncharacterized protein n=1 Tax=Anopheles darlingi TaxID=43151 RepID=A0A2M4DKX8_ANODA